MHTYQATAPTSTTPEMANTDFTELVVSFSHKMSEATAADQQAAYDYFISRWQDDDLEPLARAICFGVAKALTDTVQDRLDALTAEIKPLGPVRGKITEQGRITPKGLSKLALMFQGGVQ